MHEQLLQGFTLGHLHIDPPTGTVSGGASPAHLPSRAVEVLLRLAREPGEIVGREELLRHVWGDGRGSAEALSHAVSELRHGLGDDPSAPRFVQTVPRRGYRLIVEPRIEAPADLPPEDPGFDEPAPLLKVPFARQLVQRGVLQAAAAHLVVGWLLIQVAGETFVNLPLPPWASPAVTYVVIAGLPIVVLLAWFLEFAEGRATVDRAGGHRKGSGLERNYIAVVAAYCIAAAGVGVYQVTIGIPVPEAAGPPSSAEVDEALPVEPNSLAVLRFRTSGDDPRARLLADGLAEDLHDSLSRVPGLVVASLQDSWSLGEAADSARVRRRLRVAHYLQGTVRLEGDSLQVTIRLIDSESGFQEFSRPFAHTLEDFMQVRTEINSLTVADMRVALEADTQDWLPASIPDTDLDAYVLYRMGREIMNQPLTTESLSQAVDYFRQALVIDPGYAAAHAGLCSAFVDTFELSGRSGQIDAAEESCATALISSPNLFVVFTAMGDLYRLTNRLHLAQMAYGNAIERNPRDVDALIGLARVYEQRNQLDLAESQLQRSIRAQPGNWRAINAIGGFYFATGEFEKAAAEYRKVAFLEPENWQAQANLGAALLMSGSFDEAAEALELSLGAQPDVGSYSNLAVIYYYRGEFDTAVELYELALELTPSSIIGWLNLGDALNFAGTAAAARQAFERAAALAEERLTVNTGDSESIQALAWASAMLGQPQKARELIERAIALAPNDPYAWYYDALIRHRSGDDPGALDALESAVEHGYPRVMLGAEPYLERLRGHRRFGALLSPVRR